MTAPTRRSLSPTMVSTGYTAALGLGCVSFFFLGCALGGALLARAGGDPLSAFNSYGLAGFLFAAAILFLARVIFWDKAPDVTRAAVRTVVTIILSLGLLAVVPMVMLAWGLSNKVPHVSMPRLFGVLDLLSQIGTLVWLLRYRREPD